VLCVLLFLIPHFRCGTAFHKTRSIIFIYLVSVKEHLISFSCLSRYKFRRHFYNKVSFSVFLQFILEHVSLRLAPRSHLFIHLSLSLVFITLQAADLKTNSEQLTGAILSSFVFVTFVSRRNCIMGAAGNIIGKTQRIFIFSCLGKKKS